MKLYYTPGACSLASHIALEEGGAPYEAVSVDLKAHRTEDGRDFYGISKRGYVPAIETEDGLLTENPAVLTYIADHTGKTPAGADRYRMLEWIAFAGSELHKGFGPFFKGGDEAAKQEARTNLAKKFKLAAELMEGRDWTVGAGPSVADNYLLVMTLWAQKFEVELPAELEAFRERNLKRESVKRAMKAEGLI